MLSFGPYPLPVLVFQHCYLSPRNHHSVLHRLLYYRLETIYLKAFEKKNYIPPQNNKMKIIFTESLSYFPTILNIQFTIFIVPVSCPVMSGTRWFIGQNMGSFVKALVPR